MNIKVRLRGPVYFRSYYMKYSVKQLFDLIILNSLRYCTIWKI